MSHKKAQEAQKHFVIKFVPFVLLCGNSSALHQEPFK